MTPERWQRIKSALEELDSVAEADRDSLLSRLSGSDPELLADLGPFLAAGSTQAGTGEFIAGAIREQAVSLNAVTELSDRFGRYRLIRKVGQGGMGAVYEAVRVDDFRKTVALKIVRTGLDSDFARTRFRDERQMLATLEHPYIARLLDGGQSDDGSPYLVLEFVNGETVTKYCADLPQAARLKLFLRICEAVEYAHRNLIVHRDLKPENILVTPEGAPKLLDFGIARLLVPDALQTMTGFQALTPQYASPEQIRGEPVTTASDVYSLGMVLYEMLTGRRPYLVDTTSVSEIARTVCEVQPARPELGGDLDNILYTALRKEAARRYTSVQDFAADIERFLSYRPVRARPDTLAYRASKFLRRNRVAVAAGVLLIGSLSGALVLTLSAEQRAKARFDQVRQLATKFLFEFDRDIRQLPGSAAAREKLVTTALQQLDSLSTDSSNEDQLNAELAQAYASVGDVVGMPGLPSLGHMDRAEKSYRKAAAMAEELIRRDPSAAGLNRGLACNTHIRLGYLLWRMGRSEEGRAMIVRGLDYIGPKLASGKPVAADFRIAANAHAYLSAIDLNGFRTRSAADEATKAAALMRRVQELAPGLRAQSDLARVLAQAGQATGSAGNLEESLARLEESAAAREAIRGTNSGDVENRRELALIEEFIGSTLYTPDGIGLDRQGEALTHMSRSLALFRELADADPRNASARNDLALTIPVSALLRTQTEPSEAERSLHEAIRIFESLPATFGGRDRHIGLAWANLATVLRKAHRLVEARAALDEAERLYAHDKPQDELARGDFLTLWDEQAQFALAAGDKKSALAAYTRMWDALQPTVPAAREDMSAAWNLAICARGIGRAGGSASAADWKAKSAAFWQPWKGRYPHIDRQLDTHQFDGAM